MFDQSPVKFVKKMLANMRERPWDENWWEEGMRSLLAIVYILEASALLT